MRSASDRRWCLRPRRSTGIYYLLTTDNSLLTASCLLLTTYLLTTHYSLLTTHYLLLTTYYSPLTTYYVLTGRRTKASPRSSHRSATSTTTGELHQLHLAVPRTARTTSTCVPRSSTCTRRRFPTPLMPMPNCAQLSAVVCNCPIVRNCPIAQWPKPLMPDVHCPIPNCPVPNYPMPNAPTCCRRRRTTSGASTLATPRWRGQSRRRPTCTRSCTTTRWPSRASTR